jgi:hypothetical protein
MRAVALPVGVTGPAAADGSVTMVENGVGTPTVKVSGKALPTNESLTAEGSRNAVVAAG